MVTMAEKPLVIGVLGTHSTGKSSFLARLCSELRRLGFEVSTVTDLGEQAQRTGLPILYNHTWVSTSWFITRGISLELEAWPHSDVVLVDRAVPDALGYLRAALDFRGEEIDRARMQALEAMVRTHSTHYDLLFQTKLDPTIPLGSNKARDADTRFRQLAAHHVDQALRDLRIPSIPLPADGHEKAIEHAVQFVTSSPAA